MTKNFPYSNTEEEYDKVKEFLTRVQDLPDYDDNWDVSRFNWWRYSCHSQKEVSFFRENAHVWADGEENVVGLSISEYGNNDFFALADPAYPDLFEEIIKWTETVWAKDRDEISTYVFDFDKKKTDMLTALGYQNVRPENNVRYYDLTSYDFSYDLKPGYKIIPFKEFGDYDSRVALVKSAFNVENYPKERLVALHSSPQYLPELDLVVVNSEGVSVAYCMGWVEEHDDTLGYIEPMGTHADFRRMGFASSLAKECFKRLAARGVKTASIASDAEPNISNFLYESLNPIRIKRGFEYKKVLKK